MRIERADPALPCPPPWVLAGLAGGEERQQSGYSALQRLSVSRGLQAPALRHDAREEGHKGGAQEEIGLNWLLQKWK